MSAIKGSEHAIYVPLNDEDSGITESEAQALAGVLDTYGKALGLSRNDIMRDLRSLRNVADRSQLETILDHI